MTAAGAEMARVNELSSRAPDAVAWAKDDPCRVVTGYGDLAGFVNSASPHRPQAYVQVCIPSVCLLVMFRPDAGEWRIGSWRLERAATRPAHDPVRPGAAEWVTRFAVERERDNARRAAAASVAAGDGDYEVTWGDGGIYANRLGRTRLGETEAKMTAPRIGGTWRRVDTKEA